MAYLIALLVLAGFLLAITAMWAWFLEGENTRLRCELDRLRAEGRGAGFEDGLCERVRVEMRRAGLPPL